MGKYTGLLADLDGTLYFKGQLMPGVHECLQALQRQGVVIRYLTNTAGIPTGALLKRLQSYGLTAKASDVVTPLSVAMAYCRQQESLSYYVMASQEVQAEFQRGHWDERRPDIVVLGDLQTCCTYEEINKVFNFLSDGSRLFTTSYSRYFYSAQGQRMIDTGAFTRMYEAALGIKAEILGKPAPFFYEMALVSAGLPKTACLAVGDDIETDIRGAHEFGIDAALVQSGKYDASTLKDAEIQPDFVLRDFSALQPLFE